jgi:group I intron endonuclease
MGVVYCATLRLDGRRYVGQTTKTVIDRERGHWKIARKGQSNNVFHLALFKYGRLAFVWNILAIAEDEQLDELESKFIEELNTTGEKGFNRTDGGSGGRHTADVRRRMSVARKGQQLTSEQREAWERARWWLDPDRRAEVSKKIANTLRERGIHPRVDNRGRKMSAETRLKMALAHTGRSSGAKGRQHSEETRKKMSLSHTGVKRGPMSAVTKKKISDAKRNIVTASKNGVIAAAADGGNHNLVF